jgi:hypothetical protein
MGDELKSPPFAVPASRVLLAIFRGRFDVSTVLYSVVSFCCYI